MPENTGISGPYDSRDSDATQPARRPVSRALRAAVIVVLAASGMVAAFATIAPSPDAELLPFRAARTDPVPLRLPDPALEEGFARVHEERYGRRDSVAQLLARLGVSGDEASELLRSGALRRLAKGQTLRAELGPDGELRELTYLVGRNTLVTVARDGERFRASNVRAPLELRTVLSSAVVRSSLFAAADTASIPDSVSSQLADIFGGDVDFNRDLRRGDRFSVVYEMYYYESRPVQAGRVLAAEFAGQGRTLRAVYFAGPDGKGGYYDPEGKSMRKAFLRSPLAFSRVTSRFGMRVHPFKKIWLAHKGTDFGAPIGTPVRAVGDGVVVFRGRSRGYGNMIVLRHYGPYSTAYAHLSRFARGLRAGTRVEQGDTIGYVGQTGWATGPHLHYEFRIAGRPRDPLRVTLPSAHPVPKAELAAFRSRTAPLVADLKLLSGTNLALLE